MLEVEFAQFSDPGRVRSNNEDYLGSFSPKNSVQIRSHGWLFVLADGVGGQEMGEVASRAVVEALIFGFGGAESGEPHSILLTRLIQSANTLVYQTGRAASPGGRRMASTVVSCALRFDRATLAHVGDSRCYLIRQGRAAALTQDHSVANEQVRLGVLAARDAAATSTRHLLTRSVGNDLFVAVEVNDYQVYPGDVFLLCSDGLHGSVTAEDMAQTMQRTPDLASAARTLVALANERDGSDNASVQLIRVQGVERMGLYRGRPYKLR